MTHGQQDHRRSVTLMISGFCDDGRLYYVREHQRVRPVEVAAVTAIIILILACRKRMGWRLMIGAAIPAIRRRLGLYLEPMRGSIGFAFRGIGGR